MKHADWRLQAIPSHECCWSLVSCPPLPAPGVRSWVSPNLVHSWRLEPCSTSTRSPRSRSGLPRTRWSSRCPQASVTSCPSPSPSPLPTATSPRSCGPTEVGRGELHQLHLQPAQAHTLCLQTNDGAKCLYSYISLLLVFSSISVLFISHKKETSDWLKKECGETNYPLGSHFLHMHTYIYIHIHINTHIS